MAFTGEVKIYGGKTNKSVYSLEMTKNSKQGRIQWEGQQQRRKGQCSWERGRQGPLVFHGSPAPDSQGADRKSEPGSKTEEGGLVQQTVREAI